MKGVRFYLEHDTMSDKRKGSHNGNVFAAFTDTRRACAPFGSSCIDGIGAVLYHPNADVAGTSAGLDYISDRCKRIPEQTARAIHPRLFERLDDDQ